MLRPDENWHNVQQGEWLNSIARQYNIRDPQRIWEHIENAQLKSQRDPNILYPGDRLYIPPLEEKEEVRTTDAHHKFQAKSFLERFEVTLKDPNGDPYIGLKYRLVIRNQEYNGSTDGGGTLRVEQLKVYSGDIARLELPEIFKVYNIKLGDMNPIKKQAGDPTPTYDDGLSGALMRLKSIGYYFGRIPRGDEYADIDPTLYSHAIAGFQLFEMNRDPTQVTGVLDDETRRAIQSASIE